MIARRTVLYLGCSQLLCWGISYYLIGALGQPMAEGLGWSASVVHGGFSLALLVMPNSPALWVAAGVLWIMDASINVSMFVALSRARRPSAFTSL